MAKKWDPKEALKNAYQTSKTSYQPIGEPPIIKPEMVSSLTPSSVQVQPKQSLLSKIGEGASKVMEFANSPTGKRLIAGIAMKNPDAQYAMMQQAGQQEQQELAGASQKKAYEQELEKLGIEQTQKQAEQLQEKELKQQELEQAAGMSTAELEQEKTLKQQELEQEKLLKEEELKQNISPEKQLEYDVKRAEALKLAESKGEEAALVAKREANVPEIEAAYKNIMQSKDYLKSKQGFGVGKTARTLPLVKDAMKVFFGEDPGKVAKEQSEAVLGSVIDYLSPGEAFQAKELLKGSVVEPDDLVILSGIIQKGMQNKKMTQATGAKGASGSW